MGKSARRNLIAILFGMLLALVLGEVLLSLFDPLGFAYYRDQAYLSTQLVADPRGYTFRTGTHTLLSYTFTILPDGTRAVPDTNVNGSKTLVFVGDSVTFGYGVDDDQAWVNLVARELPDVHVINAGISGFNSTNALRTVEQYPNADALVYLLIGNDADEENHPDFDHLRQPVPLSWLATYLTNLPTFLNPVGVDGFIARGNLPRYLGEVRQINADPRTLLVAFDNELTTLTIQQCCAVTLINRGTDRVSPADGHPGVRGSQEIAAQMLLLVRQRFGL